MTQGATSEAAAGSVAVVGLGLMGSALASAFLGRGHATTVWNRSAAKAAPLVDAGARVAPTPAEAVVGADVVVVCLSDSAAVRDVLSDAGALAGRVVVNLTSGTPSDARELAGWAAAADADYLDGAIMAIPPFIGQPQALLLYSGSETAFAAAEPALGALGAARYLGADAGFAALFDLALLGSMWSMLAGFFHASALVGTEGVSTAELEPLVTGWLTGILGFLPVLAGEIDAGEYATDVSTVATSAAGIDHLVHASVAQGIGIDVPGPLKALIDRAVRGGHGEDSLSSLVELIKAPATVA